MTHNEGRTKRARRLVFRPSSGHCKTCRARKVKCDEGRPTCRRCAAAGYECEGYRYCDIALGTNVSSGSSQRKIGAAPSLAVLPTSINDASLNQIQLFAEILEQQYHRNHHLVPLLAVHADSFLLRVASSSLDLPLLRNAIDTLCLSHLAKRSRDVRVLHELRDSHRSLLALIQRAVASSTSAKLLCSHRDVIASILVVSLINAPLQKRQPASPVTSSFDVHLRGALQYLEAYGPSVLAGGTPVDFALLEHLRVQGRFQQLARRERGIWVRPEWNAIGNMPFAHVPTESDIVTILLTRVPGMLSDADDLLDGSSLRTTFTAMHQHGLICALNGLQESLIQPWWSGEMSAKPGLADLSSLTLIPEFSGPVFTKAKPWITEFYVFPDPLLASCNVTVHYFGLIADCTLLRLLYDARKRNAALYDSVSIRLEDVELRAYTCASNLCRYLLHCVSRSISAMTYVCSVLEASRSFFESYGCEDEASWCKLWLAAVLCRMENLRSTSPPTLCPVGAVMAGLSTACSYTKSAPQLAEIEAE